MTRDTSITLRSTDDALRLAQIASSSGLTAYRRPEAAAVVLLTGHELGLGPMASLRGIYEVSGRPVLSADLMVAVVRASGHCDSWRVVESTTETCTITTRRKGESEPESCTWTMADAKRAGCGGQTWAKFPRQMLAHRCAAELARRTYPDVLLGLYTPEEMGASVAVDGTPERAVIEAQPAPAAPAEDHDEEREAIQSETGPTPYERGESLLSGARTLAALAGAWAIVRAEILGRCGPGERTALAALKDRRKAELQPPPTGTDGAPTAAPAEGASAETSTGDAATAELPAWTRSTDGQRVHVAAKVDPHEIRASALRWAPLLGDTYVGLCAQRVVALTGGQHTQESALRWCRTRVVRARRAA